MIKFTFKEETDYDIKGIKAILSIDIDGKIKGSDYDEVMKNWENIKRIVTSYGKLEKDET